MLTIYLVDNVLPNALHRVRAGNRLFASSHISSLLDSFSRLYLRYFCELSIDNGYPERFFK